MECELDNMSSLCGNNDRASGQRPPCCLPLMACWRTETIVRVLTQGSCVLYSLAYLSGVLNPCRAGATAQLLAACTALPEDPSLVPSIYVVWLTTACTFRGLRGPWLIATTTCPCIWADFETGLSVDTESGSTRSHPTPVGAGAYYIPFSVY